MWASIVQTLIVAGVTAIVTAIFTSYVTSKVLEERIKNLDNRIRENKREIDRMRARMHDWAGHIGWVEQRRRFSNRDGEPE